MSFDYLVCSAGGRNQFYRALKRELEIVRCVNYFPNVDSSQVAISRCVRDESILIILQSCTHLASVMTMYKVLGGNFGVTHERCISRQWVWASL